MPKDALTLVLRGDEVPLADFAKAVNALLRLVQALAGEVAAGSGVEWFVEELETGSAVATIRGVPRTEAEFPAVEGIVRAYERVGLAVARHEPIPYSPAVRSAVAEITSIINGRVTSVTFETDEEGAEVYTALRPGVSPATGERFAILPVTGTTYGAVRGRIETLSSHEGLRFTLYETNTGRAVRCFLAAEEPNREQMRNAWGRLAVVEGVVQRDPVEGHALTVRQVRRIEILPEKPAHDWRDARGAAPSASGSISPEEAIRRGRDGEA